MGQPVVHFEIIGGNPAELRAYYAELFGWPFRENSPVAPEVSRTDSYSFIDRMTTDDGTGIPGGVGGGSTFGSHAIFYVGVPDVDRRWRPPPWTCKRCGQEQRKRCAGGVAATFMG